MISSSKLGNSKNTVRAKAGDSLTDKWHNAIWQEVPINSDYKRKPRLIFMFTKYGLDS